MVKIIDYKILYSSTYNEMSKEVSEHCRNGYIVSGSLQVQYVNGVNSTNWNYFQPLIKIDQSVLIEDDGKILLDFFESNNE